MSTSVVTYPRRVLTPCMFSLPVCVHVTSSRIPFAAAQAISPSFSAPATPRPRPPPPPRARAAPPPPQAAPDDREPVLRLGRLVRPAHETRVADDLVRRERGERSAGQRRLLSEPAAEADIEPADGD